MPTIRTVTFVTYILVQGNSEYIYLPCLRENNFLAKVRVEIRFAQPPLAAQNATEPPVSYLPSPKLAHCF